MLSNHLLESNKASAVRLLKAAYSHTMKSFTDRAQASIPSLLCQCPGRVVCLPKATLSNHHVLSGQYLRPVSSRPQTATP
ncbi:hypothetical protein DUNSADRAFT_1225 [Dunaliella salina]|uniref:Encoded protein n=1 Tax=Dunaliella salina TaxID=3046 RepID=A0ABQ7FXS9_DUNSA|nr:hypothetical protein DUNSADRAFT_1225 [Dunaliella salina]|eukprot:KAF5827163.1 hypothetical protein DUNSADRAFT_1225 [Dunaliella salina]